MVIKILKAEASFAGVQYSERRVKENKTELLSANNFPLEDMTAEEHVNFLEFVSGLNPRVKKKQFHATISGKGREQSFRELERTAKDYLEFMGYGEQPYVIYAHKDSPNNHVHIVSTRVGVDGKRIDDSFERMRTQKFIKNELGIDFAANPKEDFENAIDYSFKDISALDSILGKQGYRTYVKRGKYLLVKSGEVKFSYDMRRLKASMYRTMFDHRDVNRVRAQLWKYSKATDLENLKAILHEKLGLELIYRYAYDASNHNWENRTNEVLGYSVIDHRNKLIFTEKVLLSIGQLQEQANSMLTQEDIDKILWEIRTGEGSYIEISEFLTSQGMHIEKDGTIRLREGKVIGKLDGDTIGQLFYRQRVTDANNCRYSRHVSKYDLAELYRIGTDDINYESVPLSKIELEKYSRVALSYLRRNPDTPLPGNDIFIKRFMNGCLLVDRRERIVLNVEEDLGIRIPSELKIKLNNPRNDYEILAYPTHHGNLDRLFTELLYNDLETFGSENKRRRRRRNYNL